MKLISKFWITKGLLKSISTKNKLFQQCYKQNNTYLDAKYKSYFNQINQFSGPAYPWGVAGAAAQVGASKHLDPLQQRIDVLLGCQGETN